MAKPTEDQKRLMEIEAEIRRLISEKQRILRFGIGVKK